jgi:hypothetical protein
VRYLRESGLEAQSIASHWEGEGDDDVVIAAGEEVSD